MREIYTTSAALLGKLLFEASAVYRTLALRLGLSDNEETLI